MTDALGSVPAATFTFAAIRELTAAYVYDSRLLQTLFAQIDQTESALRAGDKAAAQRGSQTFVNMLQGAGSLAVPQVSPSAAAFVGGWGSSMYQYAFD